MTTQRIIGLVTDVRGRFLCRRCNGMVDMIAIIDRLDVRARVWREIGPHACDPLRDESPVEIAPCMRDGNDGN